MYITEVSIKRPVVAWVMSLILIIFGIFVFSELPVRELPDGIQPPVVQVQTDYKSASAEIVDEEITQKLEDVIGGAEGIKSVLDDIVYDEVTGRNINITGVGTINGVKIGDPTGIVTAASPTGIVTYFGDGSNLTGAAPGLSAAIGISSGGTQVGSGITMVDFTTTNATITVAVPPATATGVATVNIQPSVSLGLVIALGG